MTCTTAQGEPIVESPVQMFRKHLELLSRCYPKVISANSPHVLCGLCVRPYLCQRLFIPIMKTYSLAEKCSCTITWRVQVRLFWPEREKQRSLYLFHLFSCLFCIKGGRLPKGDECHSFSESCFRKHLAKQEIGFVWGEASQFPHPECSPMLFFRGMMGRKKNVSVFLMYQLSDIYLSFSLLDSAN